MTKARILTVDDDKHILELITLNLKGEGYQIDMAKTGEEALQKLKASTYDLIILDIMLPGIDGLDVAREIRKFSDIPILMLSAKDSDMDKALGLGIGADDYITKPFSPIELIARVKALLRRYQKTTHRNQEIIEAYPIRLDLTSHRTWLYEREIQLTAKEFSILKLLVSYPGAIYTKAQIFQQVWGEEYLSDENTVMVHIRRLRSKIEKDASQPQLIQTVWGIGYRYTKEEEL